MFKTILFPTDGSPLSDKATVTAVQMARLHGARIIAISVIQPFPFLPMGDSGVVVPDAGIYERQMNDAAERNIAKVGLAAQQAGVPYEGLVVMSPSPYEEIVEAAKKHGVDLIVMASHGRSGLNRLLLGSETQKVLSHTELPVLILR